MAGAAFFDLDRTLLATSSSEVFADALTEAGYDPPRIPGQRLLFGVFNAIGENLPSMVIARQAVALARGRAQADMRAAAEGVSGRLVDMVKPFAHSVFDEHRSAGRPIVLATTSPYDLVEPFARKLGLDDVIATRYAVDEDGRYDGTLDGPFVWSAGKLKAITAWAIANDVDLDESYAYSDSVYDTPMLDAVGHPVAVNPDPRLAVVATARRWPMIDFDVAPGVRKVPIVGVEVQRLMLQFARPLAYPYARFDIDGTEHIPRTGGAILCANHRSYFDVAAMSIAIARAGRPARFLGKKEVFEAPIIGPLATAMGGIRVDRGTGSEEPLQAAANSLAAGEMIAMMPQGTIPRGPAFFEPPKARSGVARLAELSGAPVVPIGLWGTEEVWPRSQRWPNMLNLADPPTVRIRVGPPIDLPGGSPEADSAMVMEAIVDLLPDEARRAVGPTEEQLARTYPPGYRGDPAAERDRRPGTD